MSIYQATSRLCTWAIDPTSKPRKYATFIFPFKFVRDHFFVQPYEHTTGGGFQRDTIPSHVRKLAAAMKVDDFTPTTWCAAVLSAHEKDIKNDIKDGVEVVTISFRPKTKFPLIDGGHRSKSLERLLSEADDDTQQTILELPITIQIFLDPDRIQKDFLNLQSGAAVNANQLQSMRDKDNSDPIRKMAVSVCENLSKDKESHLFGQVRFDDRTASRPLNYKTLLCEDKPSLSFSIIGGARIAMGAAKPQEWLQGCYLQVYKDVFSLGKGGAPPDILLPGKILCPTLHEGTRGGSSLLLGLGNMLGWRKTQEGEDAKGVGWTASSVWNYERTWQSVQDKREAMGSFARRYFADMDVAKYDGVPAALVNLLSPATFMVGAEHLPVYKRGGPSKPRSTQ